MADAAAAPTVRVLHVISGLGTGGAERMLTRLATQLPASDVWQEVASLTGPGTFGRCLREAGVPVHDLRARTMLHAPAATLRLVDLLRRSRPDVVMTWLYHADLVGTAAAALARHQGGLAWNVRCSAMDERRYGMLTRLLAAISGRPDVVVANSHAGRDFHARRGYRPGAWAVLPNGFDTTLLAPDPGAAARVRTELGLPPDSVLIGVVSRVDPMKGHDVFLRAMDVVASARPEVRGILVGRGTEALPVHPAVIALGERRDVERVVPGFDMVCSPSLFGEGFSNVLGEAMASGVPCVATDVGDAARIVGETGRVVPPGDVDALARALLDLCGVPDGERRALGIAARARVEENWSLPLILRRYTNLLSSLANR